MAFTPKNIRERLDDRRIAIEKQKALAAKLLKRKPKSPALEKKVLGKEKILNLVVIPEPVVVPADDGGQKVVLSGNGVLPLFVPGQRGSQFLSPALRQMVNAYLESSQKKHRDVFLLWPGSLECLPLIHMLATIETWAAGYKCGIRSLVYPTTRNSFNPLNHIFADPNAINKVTNIVQELSGENACVKQSCKEKDLMLFALNSFRKEAQEKNLRPCLNELFPHFHLESGKQRELLDQSYKDDFLHHLVTKLARGHTKSLRQNQLTILGDPKTAPDAMFSLSYNVSKKSEIVSALLNVRLVGAPDVVIVDATQASLRRLGTRRNRIPLFIHLVDEAFKESPPGILVVTDDPQQMTQLRAALVRDLNGAHKIAPFRPTRALCVPHADKGLEHSLMPDVPTHRSSIDLKIEVTDKEAAKLIDVAYHYQGKLNKYANASDAIKEASSFLLRMSNLPSSSGFLQAWLNDAMADEQQRRRYDWLAHRNQVKAALEQDIPVDLGGKIKTWLKDLDQVLSRYENGTPLGLAMGHRVAEHARNGYKTLVVLQSQFYATLAERFFLAYGDGCVNWSAEEAARLHPFVRFVGIGTIKDEIRAEWASRLVVCAMNPDLIRLLVTSHRLPNSIDLLLTQQIAVYLHHSLKPVADYEAFAPYHTRVNGILGQLKRLSMVGGAVLPIDDLDIPTFSSVLPPRTAHEEGEEADERDLISITLDHGYTVRRGLRAILYLYDPSSPESGSTGFRPVRAENIKYSDRIFVMSDELHEQIEEIFMKAGVKLSTDEKFENLLRTYHRQVRAKVTALFPGTIAESARALKAVIEREHPDLGDEMNNIRYWIDLEAAADTPFDLLMPQAPRSQKHFAAFLNALQFDKSQIDIFWELAIQKIRGTRITDGLTFGDRYSRALFDPSAAAAYDKVPREALYFLREKALENIHQVAGIVQPTVIKEYKN